MTTISPVPYAATSSRLRILKHHRDCVTTRLTSFDALPEVVFVVALLVDVWHPDVVGEDVPEQDAECVHVHAVVVLAARGEGGGVRAVQGAGSMGETG